MSLPTLEPERDPVLARPGFRLGAIGVALAAIVTGLVLGLSGGSHRHATPPVHAPPGRLLAYDNATGHLVFENLDGKRRVVVPSILTGTPTLSPDGSYVLTDSGNELFQLGSSGYTLTAVKSPVSSVHGTSNTPAQPFADHDRMVLAPRPFSAHARLVLTPIHGGQPLQLGSADDAAGDPTARAAYVTVATGSPVPAPSDPQFDLQPDGRVELRQPARAARVIVTAARLDQLARLPNTVKLLISIDPSPDGRRLLVVGRSLDANHPGGVLAVFDTADYRLIDHVAGPQISGGYWSHIGDRLAFFDGPRGLALWRPSAQLVPLVVPRSSVTQWVGCVWAPGDDRLACAANGTSAQPQPNKRLLVDLKTGQAETVSASDEPLEWLS